MTDNVEDKILGALSALATRMDQLESRITARVSFKSSGGDSATSAVADDAARPTEDQFENGTDFSFDRGTTNRYSVRSAGS